MVVYKSFKLICLKHCEVPFFMLQVTCVVTPSIMVHIHSYLTIFTKVSIMVLFHSNLALVPKVRS